MQEIWKDIEDFEGKYQVSNFGRVKSLKRKISESWKGNKAETIILNPLKGDRRYLQVSLWSNGKDHKRYIHRLVAKAFIPNPENKPQVNHKDGDKCNNAVNNLEWNTRSENVKHAISTGLNKENGKPKLTHGNIISIFRMRNENVPVYKIAKKYNVNPSCIYGVLRRDTYKHVEV